MIPKISGTSQTSIGTKNRIPQVMRVSTQLSTPAIAQVIWKFSAATACARAVGDCCPRAISAMSGATQPSRPPPKTTPAAPPKWAIRAQFLSSLLA
jgi:hypothetical protein